MMGTLSAFIAAFFGGGVGAALLPLVFDAWRARQSRRETVRHLAMRIAYALEGYAIECSTRLSNHELAGSTDGQSGEFLSSVPAPPEYPASPAYDTIDTDLLAELFEFPQRCLLAERRVQIEYEILGTPDGFETCRANTVRLGVRALELARMAREKYNLPRRNVRFNEWSVTRSLTDKAAKLDV